MEVILDLYTAPYNEDEPLICMDEASQQLLSDVYAPLPMRLGHDAKEDYHYEREGVRSLFMFFDPFLGWRRVSHRKRRTRVDWAHEIRTLLDEDYPQARKVILVCDNLNTHSIASLYEAFPAPEAHRLARRLDIRHTPRNGSWLNIAEIEIGVLQGQCLDRRIPDDETFDRELKAWQKRRNAEGGKVNWRFTTEDARIKLWRLYPQCTVLE